MVPYVSWLSSLVHDYNLCTVDFSKTVNIVVLITGAISVDLTTLRHFGIIINPNDS